MNNVPYPIRYADTDSKKNPTSGKLFFRPSKLTNQSAGFGHVTHALGNESTVFDYKREDLDCLGEPS